MKSLRTTRLVSLLLFCTLWLPACGGNGAQTFDTHQALLELATRAATARVLAEKPAWRPTVLDIATRGQQLLTDSETTLGALETFIAAEIPWNKLMPEEQALARVALEAIREGVENYLAKEGIQDPAEARVRVAVVLGWIADTARVSSG